MGSWMIPSMQALEWILTMVRLWWCAHIFSNLTPRTFSTIYHIKHDSFCESMAMTCFTYNLNNFSLSFAVARSCRFAFNCHVLTPIFLCTTLKPSSHCSPSSTKFFLVLFGTRRCWGDSMNFDKDTTLDDGMNEHFLCMCSSWELRTFNLVNFIIHLLDEHAKKQHLSMIVQKYE